MANWIDKLDDKDLDLLKEENILHQFIVVILIIIVHIFIIIIGRQTFKNTIPL